MTSEHDLSGMICLVTGANSGLGKVVTKELAARGAGVAMLCRSRDRGETARREIASNVAGADLSLRLVDLASLGDVRRVAAELSDEFLRVDLLVNNAGIYLARREVTEDGFEKTLAVNHLAHFLLTHLLLPRLRAGGGRVVNVSSAAHRSARLRRAPLESIIRGEGDYDGFRAYGDSKAANILFTRELARRRGDDGLTAVAVHPGMVATRIWNQNRNIGSLIARLYKPFMLSPESGAESILRLATDADARAIQGGYFERSERAEPTAEASDDDLAAQLWELSDRLTGAGG